MIRFDQVTKTYAGTTRPALNGVSLEILKGEFVFLVGASGSGKSSFLRLVLKEEKPSKGKIHVLGQELNTLASRKVPYFRRNLGVVFQDFRLLPNKTVFDNVAFALQVIGKSKGFIQEAVPDVLKMVGLAGKQGRFPHELSGGEQQRVAMARAVVNKPAILLADEPTGNLDPNTSAGIMTLLSAINANGTTVIMATHDVGIVDQMQRRVIELVSGQVVRDERGGGYQTQAVPVIRQPQTHRPAQTVDSVIEDAALAAPPASQPEPRPEPARVSAEFSRPVAAQPPPPVESPTDAPVTGTITVVEPAVTNVRETPLANRPVPRSDAAPTSGKPAEAQPTPLVPPPLNEPRSRR
ncbi:MAG: ftsE [Schumannella sp.]|jgi:cell division transport system ATP-binding protein|nr:ftsE [Schumannella sp.]